MTSLLQWGANILFALMVALAYISFAMAYRTTGAPAFSLEYIFRIASNHYFLGGLTLSFLSTFVRLAMFSSLGISKTVLASELSVIMMLFLSYVFFREALSIREVLGCCLILAGIALVGWR